MDFYLLIGIIASVPLCLLFFEGEEGSTFWFCVALFWLPIVLLWPLAIALYYLSRD